MTHSILGSSNPATNKPTLKRHSISPVLNFAKIFALSVSLFRAETWAALTPFNLKNFA